MLQPMLSFKKILTKRQYGATHNVFFESLNQKTIWFNPYFSFQKFQTKDNIVQPELSFKKILTKRQYGSTNIIFFGNFYQKTIWFHPECVF